MPQLLAAAALELHAAAGSMLQGCFGIADGNAAAAQAVLEALHAALQQSDHSDGVLRGGVALRLAAMLEEQQQMDRALTVVQEVSRTVSGPVQMRRAFELNSVVAQWRCNQLGIQLSDTLSK